MSTHKDGTSPHKKDDVVLVETPQVRHPPMYKVIMLNDDFTPMDFVVYVLVRFFHKSERHAVRLMLEVHHNGFAIVGVYTREIAETKTFQVNEYAERCKFPLLCRFEKE